MLFQQTALQLTLQCLKLGAATTPEATSLGGTVSSTHHGHLKVDNGEDAVVVTRTATITKPLEC